MKKITILVVGLFVFFACSNEKKAEDKKVEAQIQKIDSISSDVKTSTKELDESAKEVKKAIEELDNI
jgi:outer membrane murein-binding lipoprotein Lpp